MTTRKSARIAQRKTVVQMASTRKPRKTTSKLDNNDASDEPDSHSASETSSAVSSQQDETGTDTDSDTDTRPAKRRKTRFIPKPSRTPNLSSTNLTPSTTLLTRPHPQTYHHPLLLTSPPSRTALLTWFTTAQHTRAMPWRKPFLPPHSPTTDPSALARRAYEVWISETMLQQTRVRTVIPYWTRWMAKWPTVEDLAKAEVDEVLGVWQGLGYYSRARRVWDAAGWVCREKGGMVPGDVEGLMAVPGVGRYTAGAVAAIVFGVAVAMVDGNVLRVLSRQMGVLGDVKGDKRVVGVLWEAAEELVRAVVRDGGGEEGVPSERPGMWGQALMELGSTVCTPKPNCAVCPITETCRAYAEGIALAEGGALMGLGGSGDIEDACTLCAPFEEAVEQDHGMRAPKKSRAKSDSEQDGLSPFFAASRKTTAPDPRTLEIISNHAKRFPLKKPKKKLREEETLVCAIRRSDGRYLIHRRPSKGLLAGLWELPSHTLPESNDSTSKSRKAKAISYVTGLVAEGKGRAAKGPSLTHRGELESVPWVFSHLKLTMHVHLFELDDAEDIVELGPERRWASVEDIERESMGTGMRKCWSLVRNKAG